MSDDDLATQGTIKSAPIPGTYLHRNSPAWAPADLASHADGQAIVPGYESENDIICSLLNAFLGELFVVIRI